MREYLVSYLSDRSLAGAQRGRTGQQQAQEFALTVSAGFLQNHFELIAHGMETQLQLLGRFLKALALHKDRRQPGLSRR